MGFGVWGMGDWGLGIGDWAQSPIPNPQSPIPNPHINNKKYKYIYYLTSYILAILYFIILKIFPLRK